jgi:hypothetical protein
MSLVEAEERGIYCVCTTLKDVEKVYLSIQLGNRPRYMSIPNHLCTAIISYNIFTDLAPSGTSKLTQVSNVWISYYPKGYYHTEIKFHYDEAR